MALNPVGTFNGADEFVERFAGLLRRRIFQPLLHGTQRTLPVAFVFVTSLPERQALFRSEKERFLYRRREVNESCLDQMLPRLVFRLLVRLFSFPLLLLFRTVRRRFQFIAVDESFYDGQQRTAQKGRSGAVEAAEKIDLSGWFVLVGDDLLRVDLHHGADPLATFAGPVR